MNVPANLKYTKDHEWVKLEGNIAIVGVTDFAQSELGDIVYIEVENDTYLRALGTTPNGREGVADKLSDDSSART